MPQPSLTPDSSPENIDTLKAELAAVINGLPNGKEIIYNGGKLQIRKEMGRTVINEFYSETLPGEGYNRVGGAMYTVLPDGTITDYRLMPRDLNSSRGSFDVSADLYSGLINCLTNNQ